MLLEPRCALCHQPGAVVCSPCEAGLAPPPSLPVPLGLDGCVAALEYGAARHLLTGLKNRGRRDVVGWLAARMAHRVPVEAGPVVTWAPTGAARRRARGFDQAELLARAVARRWRRPCQELLLREPGPPQAGRGAAARRANPSFRAVGAIPATVVVVDDVATTGATLTAAARALRAAGAGTVIGLVAARAPVSRAAPRLPPVRSAAASGLR